MTSSTSKRAAVIAASLLCAQTVRAQGDDPARTSYPAAYFDSMQPYSAFDMLSATPGFTFAESDPDVRGFAGAAGNVLIDGARPATKQESLETTLRRIPASAVERIELIRAGGAGVDMQGHAVLANVVRARALQSRGAVELAATFYEGFSAPRAAGEWSREAPSHRFELSAAAYEEAADEHGVGDQTRAGEAGELLADARYEHDERERALELAARIERRLAHGTLRANGSLLRGRTRASVLEAQRFPDRALESDLEHERERDIELGVQYDGVANEGVQLAWLGLHRRTYESEREESVDAQDRSSFAQLTDASESIVRGSVLGALGRATAEAGLEGARNVLDGRSALAENGVSTPLPAADVRVEERRIEAFALGSLALDAHWTLEAGARFEYSTLEQAGDSNVSKAFFFPKPRALLSYATADAGQWRLLVERRVGQLDFEDFVTSTSLATDTVSAGNPDLEPDTAWIAELAWERQWRRDAAVLLAVRRRWISDLIDRTPLAVDGELLDSVGNIGDGVRDEFEISFTAPLQAIGLDAARVKAMGLWRRSETTDPTTGTARAISEDLPFEGALQLTHDLTALKLHWGVEIAFGTQAQQFTVDEVRTERFGTQIDVYVEYKPTPAWNVRMAACNLTDRRFERERQIHDGPRDQAPLSYIETTALRLGPYYAVSVRRSFGD